MSRHEDGALGATHREGRGLGPWDPAYFNRDPTEDELRRDLLEREASCEHGRSALAWLAPHVRQARLAHWEQVRNEPVVNIERVLQSPVTVYDQVTFLVLVDQIDQLPCEDPRKSVYRLELVKRFRALWPRSTFGTRAATRSAGGFRVTCSRFPGFEGLGAWPLPRESTVTQFLDSRIRLFVAVQHRLASTCHELGLTAA